MLIFRRFAFIGAVKSLLRDCEQILENIEIQTSNYF